MDRSRKLFTFSDGREISVFESTWDSASIRGRIEEKARSDRDRLNGSGDPVFLYFVESFYSYLASCSEGEIPDEHEAYTLSDEDLDRWYRSIVEVNPGAFVEIDFDKRGEVVFRDGTRFEIVSSYLPSVILKRARIEEEALKREPDRNNPKDIFGVYIYPVLASCSVGEIPPPDIRANWPETEIYKWRDAVAEVNPNLFEDPEEINKRALAESRVIEKKRSRRPRRSRNS